MREEEIDQLIASWDERLRRVDENLIALEGEPTYQMLGGGRASGSGRAGLVGETKARVGPALDALGDLFEHRERLNVVVARAKKLREDLSFWNKDEKLAEIVALLGGPSITLGTRQLPVAQRNLLDAATSEVAIVPEQLLNEMVRAYQLARDAVAEVGAAWGRLEPLLLDIEREVALVQAEATALDQEEATRTELEQIASLLARVRTTVSTDPLGVTGSVDSDLAPRVSQLRAKLSDLANHKASVTRGLSAAAALLSELAEADRMAMEAVVHASREFAGFEVGATARAARQEVVQGLIPWREKIESAAKAAHWKAADVGLARWLEVAHGIVAAQREVIRVANGAEQTRTELGGRLSARRAQATALASRGIVAPVELEQLARDAEATLRARPTDLAKAARDIDRYEAAVRALTARV